MNINKILDLFKNCDFSNDVTSDNCESAIIDWLPDDFRFSYSYGVSKLVILPEGENFVIKIPFIGSTIVDDSDEEYEDKVEPFCMANYDEWHCWDYCFTEVLYYHDAKKKRVAEILAKPLYVGKVSGYPIYIQDNAETFSSRKNSGKFFAQHIHKGQDFETKSKTIRSKCDEENLDIFNFEWIMDVFDYYGEKKFNKIIKFISKLEDLHNANIGYIGILVRGQ